MSLPSRAFACLGIISLLLPVSARAQYSITMADYPVIGTSATYFADTTGQVAVNVGGAGENQVWSFTQNLIGKEFEADYALPGASPYYSSELAAAQWVHMNKQWFSINPIPLISPNPIRGFFSLDYFERAENDTVYALGIGFAVPPFLDGSYLLDKEQVNFPLPLEYGKSWIRRSTVSDNLDIPWHPTPTIVLVDSSHVLVDGWGTLTIPFGSFQCLRLKIDRIVTYTAYWLGQPIYTDKDTLITYEWHTRGAGLLLQMVSHAGETDDNFAEAGLVVRLDSSNVLTGVTDDTHSRGTYSPPAEYALRQNYPNPFNPRTTLEFILPQGGEVKIEVYSLLGRRVRTLLNERREAGSHSLAWDGLDDLGIPLPAGVYLCRLSAGDFVSSVKMAYLR